jgi:DNA-binding transcriptional ArsR family regulator
MPRAPTETVELAELSTRPIRVARSSINTVFVLVLDALRPDPHRGLSAELRRAIQATLPGAVRSALAPLVAPYRRWPDCLGPPPEPGARRFEDALREIADTPADVLLGELAAEGLEHTIEWRPVVRSPRAWLRVYVEALRRAWEVLDPLWRDAAPRLEREDERVATAKARGALPELFSTFCEQTPVRNDVLLLPDGEPRRLGIPEKGLTVIPLLTGPGAHARYYAAGAQLTHFAYPIPTARASGPAVLADSELTTLLGRPRAAILTGLERPMAAGDVARVLHAVPSAASHHLSALESAGLVARHRDGRQVVVERTARGDALLALFCS